MRFWGGRRAGGAPRRCAHRQLLADVLYRGLQCPRPLGGLILHSLHCLQQGRDVGHHHLWEGEQNWEKAPWKAPGCCWRLSLPRCLVWICPFSILHSYLLILLSVPPCPDCLPVILPSPDRHRSPFLLFFQPSCPIPFSPLRPSTDLGGVLQLVDSGVIPSFASSCFGGTDQIPKCLGHVLHSIDQNHLGRARPGSRLCCGHTQVVGGVAPQQKIRAPQNTPSTRRSNQPALPAPGKKLNHTPHPT